MRRLTFLFIICFLLFATTGRGAEWSSSTCAEFNQTRLETGKAHTVLRITAVSDGSAGTITLSGECLYAISGAQLTQVVVDPDGTLTAAANFEMRDASGGLIFNTDDCTNSLHITNTVVLGDTSKTTGGDDYPWFMGATVLTMDDIGDANDTAYIYLYLSR
jgi:hypothetical protein